MSPSSECDSVSSIGNRDRGFTQAEPIHGQRKQKSGIGIHASNHLSYEETGIQFGISGSRRSGNGSADTWKTGWKGLSRRKKADGQECQSRKPPLTRYEELLAENEYLRAENEYLKKLNALVAEREEREKENRVAIISELRQNISFGNASENSNIPRSSYYYHLKHTPEPAETHAGAGGDPQICAEHKGRYGYRRVTLALRQRGVPDQPQIGDEAHAGRASQLSVAAQEVSFLPRRDGEVAPNRLNRHFKAAQPNPKWTTDITEFKVQGRNSIFLPHPGSVQRRDRELFPFEDPRLPPGEDMLQEGFPEDPRTCP